MINEILEYLYVIPMIIGGIFAAALISVVADYIDENLSKYIKNIKAKNWIRTIIFGLIIPLLLGFIVSSMLGQPSCAEYGDYNQTCVSYNDDEFEASEKQKAEKFKNVFYFSSFVLIAITTVNFQEKTKKDKII